MEENKLPARLKGKVERTIKEAKEQHKEKQANSDIERYNLAAERYFQELKDADHLKKPFSNLHEGPSVLFNLSLALANLNLGPGDLVLDFGSGSGWLSAALNLMGCRTVALDVSPTALALGRHMFESDPRFDLTLEPRFEQYDGLVFPFPDNHFDNIICMDAFHHVPNPRTILAEMYRVLKEGRRVVFSEPGKGHADSVRSRRESAHYGVLETELDLDDFRVNLLKAGFERVFVKPFPPLHWIYTYEQYRQFMEGDDGLYHLNAVRAETERYYVVLAQKGEEHFDSVHPNKLSAEISTDRPSLKTGRGEEIGLQVSLRNTGDSTWLAHSGRRGGSVELGAHLFDSDGNLLEEGWYHWSLEGDLAPESATTLRVSAVAPVARGRYRIQLDLLNVGRYWFAEMGSTTADIALEVS